ncbi:MAG: aspartate kinase [Candidatus Cloacimonetes bacterium]|nr:aspartate kinase [Candidatus Cloacimonadota bacterium]MCF7814214.1 aspartate kinase [Candidatus Cloacimonadota bacterium]MCF7868127.1 aspartate kinase [Candidatus Cloacimonadota bacterium]MCF7883593.1 aspartate kinase [Candidatus Cloacimonadota bacterium]
MTKNIIIQKFGGTSLHDKKIRRIAASHVKCLIEQDISPVIVVSAIGRKGDPYATDSLLDLSNSEFPQINYRNKDFLLSCGEAISAVVFSQALKQIEIDAVPLTGFQAGILTDDNFGNAKVQKVFIKKLLDIIGAGKVPVVCGFQGMDINGEVTTLGRGGSDTTASVLGIALNAQEIRIYTDVDGIRSADPNKKQNSRVLNETSYEEIVELAYKGANVIHPRAVEIASENFVPIRILSINSGIDGTLIKKIKSDKPVTGISSKRDIIFVHIAPNEINDYHTGIRIFQLFAAAAISVDFIDIRQDSISFIIDADMEMKAVEILKKNNFDFELKNDLCKVSVVGSGMTGQPGIMAKIVEALHSQKITILECTDSRTSISCLIAEKNEIKAISALHKIFDLDVI